jgi:hypothetical protein
VKVGWVTHHLPGERDNPSLLSGVFAGGAEMLDFDMVATAPDGVEVQWIGPDEWEQAFDCDRVVVTGTDLLSDKAMAGLAELRPVVWVRHQQPRSDVRAHLFRMADPFVCMSDLHGQVESGWSDACAEVCNGWIDLTGITPGVKQGHALWAARNHPQKGRLAARMWAARNKVELRELSGVSRAEVLDAMTVARWFVFLPLQLDACPRTLIEAEAAGCDIVTNEFAGRRQTGPLLDVMEQQRERFWRWVGHG